jgi:hypothetical protein
MCNVSQVLSHSENGSGGHSSEVKFDLIDVTPAPVLAGFERLHDRVLGRMKMLGGVLVLGRIAAAYVAAGQAQAEMHPSVTHLQALFAASRVRLYVANLIRMRASFHDSPPPARFFNT